MEPAGLTAKLESRRAPARPHPPRGNIRPSKTAAPAPPETVDPIWLLKALALSLAAALLCVYAAACLLFYQGEWQLVLHPSHTVDRTPTSVGLPFEDVRFGDFDTGQPHLTAWWIPAQNPSSTTPQFQTRFAAYTILYLHSGSGSLSDTVPALTLLHRTGLNVFAIDYRGFGASDPSQHPDDARMMQDAQAALDYLVSTRHIPARFIIPYGASLGASLAVQLAHDHPDLPAVILDHPDPDPAATAVAARPSSLIPVRLLFGSRFAIAAPLASLKTPKLLIASGPSQRSVEESTVQNLFHHAASPSFTVILPPANPDPALENALQRFLDQYLPGK